MSTMDITLSLTLATSFPRHTTTRSPDPSPNPWRKLFNNSFFPWSSPHVPSPLAFLALQEVRRELIAADQGFFAKRTRLLLNAQINHAVSLTDVELWGRISVAVVVDSILLEWRLKLTAYDCLLDWAS